MSEKFTYKQEFDYKSSREKALSRLFGRVSRKHIERLVEKSLLANQKVGWGAWPGVRLCEDEKAFKRFRKKILRENSEISDVSVSKFSEPNHGGNFLLFHLK